MAMPAFRPGDAVEVDYEQRWYDGKLGQQMPNGNFKVEYTLDNTYEEDVPVSRMRKPGQKEAVPANSNSSAAKRLSGAGFQTQADYNNFGATALPDPHRHTETVSNQERRMDPEDRKTYTFAELKQKHANRFPDDHTRTYWFETMTPVAPVTVGGGPGTDIKSDPFMTHGQMMQPDAAQHDLFNISKDPFMTSAAKIGVVEPEEHRHSVQHDPFLTTMSGAKVPDKRKNDKDRAMSPADRKDLKKPVDRLTYRFFDLECPTQASLQAQFKNKFLQQLSARGVEGYTLTKLYLKMRPGSILMEVSGDPAYMGEVRKKCPSRSIVIDNCMGILVDPDMPDTPLPDAMDGEWVPQPEEPKEDVPAEPIIPYWYKADNNWIQCIQMMKTERDNIMKKFTGGMVWETREKKETSGEKASEWMFSHTQGKMGQHHQTTTEQVLVQDLYEDERFPADSRIWYRGGEPSAMSTMPKPQRWERLKQFSTGKPYPEMDLAAGMTTPRGGRVYQGCPENFYMIAAFQALAMKPELIANVFCNMEYSNPSLGMFILRFYKHGQWQFVDIDDHIPMMQDFTSMTAQTEFWTAYPWPALIEKAYAKIHGSYEALSGGGHVEEVLTDLTGGCATRFGTRDVANDRLWMYLHEMQKHCVFGCNINEAECSKRNIPIESHWASAIWKVQKYLDVPYICVCTSAPSSTCIHMPSYHVESPDGFGPNEGYCWLRVDDFVALFDTIFECRLVNSDLGPPSMTGGCSPGWVPNMPWYEDLWAFQAQVYAESAPCFLIDVHQVPCEITLEVSQTDQRFTGAGTGDDLIFGRQVQAPLLLRFYECSREVSEESGGEIYLVHLSAWGHTRDACTGVKVMKPGKYMAMVSVPAKYSCDKMIFRTYSTFPIRLSPVVNHRSYVAVQPARPLGAMPYSLCGFQRIESSREQMPQMFDESEGRGKPMANPSYEGSTTGATSRYVQGGRSPLAFLWPFSFPGPCKLLGCGEPKGLLGTGLCKGAGGLSMHGMPSGLQGPGMPGMGGMGGFGFGQMPGFGHQTHEDGLKVVGRFGGRGAIATVEANESQTAGCSVM